MDISPGFLWLARPIVLISLLASIVAMVSAAEPTSTLSREQSEMGLLEIDDWERVQRLTFQRRRGEDWVITRPAKSQWLPPGGYRLRLVELQGGYAFLVWPPAERPQGWFTIAAGHPHRIRVGGPPTPRVTARRYGAVLELHCKLRDALDREWLLVPKSSTARFIEEGGGIRLSHSIDEEWTLADQDQRTPPRFSVYRGDRVIASGEFEFG